MKNRSGHVVLKRQKGIKPPADVDGRESRPKVLGGSHGNLEKAAICGRTVRGGRDCETLFT